VPVCLPNCSEFCLNIADEIAENVIAVNFAVRTLIGILISSFELQVILMQIDVMLFAEVVALVHEIDCCLRCVI